MTGRERKCIEEYTPLTKKQEKKAVMRREKKTNGKKRKPPLMTGTVEGE